MPKLTNEDWVEIYYALQTKLTKIENGNYEDFDNKGEEYNAQWKAHLETIIDKIGADGENMYS
jgi:hypothetical protein